MTIIDQNNSNFKTLVVDALEGETSYSEEYIISTQNNENLKIRVRGNINGEFPLLQATTSAGLAFLKIGTDTLTVSQSWVELPYPLDSGTFAWLINGTSSTESTKPIIINFITIPYSSSLIDGVKKTLFKYQRV